MDLWNINVIQYCAILAVLQKNNSLKEKSLQPKKQMKPRWLIVHEQKINNIRRKISYISVILHCQNNNTPLTKHQETIKPKFKKWYRNIKHVTLTLNAKLAELKHELKVTSNFVKNKKLSSARNLINKKFQLNQKSVFQEWKNTKINIKTTTSKEAIELFWSNISNKPFSYNENVKWIETLERKSLLNDLQDRFHKFYNVYINKPL